MKVAAIQFKATKGDVAGSLARLVDLADEAAVDTDLVVLPEMAATGYVFADMLDAGEVAEPAEGPTFRALADVARRRGAWVVAGFPERDGRRLYNSALVIDAQGALAFVYRKMLLFDADTTWATPGDRGYRRFTTRGGTFGVGICMDLNDPAFVAWVASAAPDAVAFPTNWLDEGEDVWPYWAARLYGSGAALVAANTYGPEDAFTFSGRSAVIRGNRVLAAAGYQGDAVVRARV